MKDPELRETKIREPAAGDNNAPKLTVYQTLKCAAIIDAYMQGHEGWREIVETVLRFLQMAALEGGAGTTVSRPTAAELWEKIEPEPWPASGKPKPQPA